MNKNQVQALFFGILKSNILLSFVIFIFIAKISFSLLFINFPNNIFFADITKSNLINMLNQTRQSLGLNILTENSQLDQAAKLKAEDMIKNEYFSHISPAGTTPWYWFSKSGYDYKYAGENLAIGFYNSEDVYNAWLNSLSHKENMLNSAYTEIGTAVVSGFGNNNAIIVVQLFGTPKPINIISKITKKTTTTNNEETIVPEINNQTEVVSKEQEPLAETTNIGQKVLNYSTITEPNKNAKNNFYYRFLNFVIYSQETLFKYIILGLALIIISMFLYIISFNFNNINNGLILRSLIIISILVSSVLIDSNLIISLLPRQITI
jgi:hypothetical protein